ncbi:MAG TPA: trypsin-like peptidase domain-containing protein [Pirellulales bacterium]|nr:trypsin-like peptidase domain-containing protein [Pirellulales bacterium]
MPATVTPPTDPLAANPLLRPKKPEPQKSQGFAVDSKLLLAGALLLTTVCLPVFLFVVFRLSASPTPPAANATQPPTAAPEGQTAVLAGAVVAEPTANLASNSAGPGGPTPGGTPTTVVPQPSPTPMPRPIGAVGTSTAGMPPNSLAPPMNSPAVLGAAAVPATPGVPPSPSAPLPASAMELVSQIEPSLVVVDVGDGLGSGFVYDEQGTIVTNYHVIEGAKKATVRFADKSTADVVGFLVVAPGKDLALLRINSQGRTLKPLRTATDRPQKAEEVFAFGAPRGLESTVTNGIVSAVRQGTELRDNFKATTGVDIYTDHQHYDLDAIWIQTTAPISGGNSGGPLVNRRGEVVGLNTWNRTDGQNLNFAISIEHVKKMMESTQSGVQPLASLPKPRKPTHTHGPVDKTLAYWNEIGKINRALYDRLKRTPRPHIPPRGKRTPAFFVKLAGYYKKVADFLPESAHKLRNLDMAGVDADLVLTATNDALHLENTASTLRKLSIDAEIGTFVIIYDMDEIYKQTAVYDLMRLTLSSRYQVQFPNIASDAGVPKAKSKSADEKDADDPEAQREKDAAGKLKLAKNLLAAGKRDAARERLEQLLEEFPGTKAAEEAERELAKLDDE